MSVFKDFPGLENVENKFKDFQRPTRALNQSINQSVKLTNETVDIKNSTSTTSKIPHRRWTCST